MNIIEVIPISRGITTDTLSYFTSANISIGCIVEVPLRNKKIKGIICSIKSASEMKAEIKSADFQLRKIEKIKSKEFFSKEFMETIQATADYYATSMGAVLDVLVPEYILKNIEKLKVKSVDHNLASIKEKYTIQGDDDERYGTWKSLIRQEFAKKSSIFFLTPTIEDAEWAFELLEKASRAMLFYSTAL